MTAIRAAVLTVSDTASLDLTKDKSGPRIVELLRASGITCSDRRIVADDIPALQECITTWANSGTIDLVITTGGTGFGIRDLTPEAVSPLLERQATGLVHLLLSASLKHTPMAALSRPVAGTLKNTLVVTLPGSVKAVTENMDALLSTSILGHAIDLIKGGSGQSVHVKMGSPVTPSSLTHSGSHLSRHTEQEAHECGHAHAHRTPHPRTIEILSHDPLAPVTARHRTSPYPLVSLEDALSKIFSVVRHLEVETLDVKPALAGHIIAEDVYASVNVPPTATTSVDGYAVSAESIKPNGVYSVVTSQSHSIGNALPTGSIYRINTGGPLPQGTDAVIMVEDTRIVVEKDGEEISVELHAAVEVGENVRAPGSDVTSGDLVLRKGDRITSAGGEVGTLAFIGRREVKVFRKPRVAILSTGNEIIDLHTTDHSSLGLGDASWGGIWDTNRPSLQTALEGLGYEVIDLGIATDNLSNHVEAMKSGLRQADILISTGGTSMGPSDLFKPVIERHLNGTVHFGRVTIKPGKPTTFATIPWDDMEKPVFALPGNPASALVTFHVFVVPALRRLGGWKESACHYPCVKVRLQNAMRLDPRTEFHRVVVRATNSGLTAESTGGQRSSRASSMSGANGLIILPQRKPDGPTKLEPGTEVDAMLIGELEVA